MPQLFANNASTTIASVLSAASTSVTLVSGGGAAFPTLTSGNYFLGTLTQATNETSWEVVWCTARSNDTLTVIRAQDSTTAQTWVTGSAFSIRDPSLPLTQVQYSRLPQQNALACVGDSIIAQISINDTATVHAFSNRSPMQWVPFLTRQRVQISSDLNFGVSGDNTAALYARIDPIVAARPGWYFCNIGTNDMGSTIAFVSTQSNYVAIWSKMLSTGASVIQSTILPRTTTSGQSQQIIAINNWIKQQPARFPGLYVVDPWLEYTGAQVSTTTPSSGMSWDGLHPTGQGAYWASVKIASVINLTMADPGEPTTSIADTYNAAFGYASGNLLAFSPFSGAGGSIDNKTTFSGNLAGTVVNGWTLSGNVGGATACAGISAVASVVSKTMPNGYDTVTMQQISLANSSGVTGGFGTAVVIKQVLASPGNVVIGDQIYLTGTVEWDTDVTNLSGVALTIQTIESGTVYEVDDGLPVVSDLLPTPSATISGVLRTPARTIVASPTFIQCIGFIYMTNHSSVGVSGTVRFGNLALRKL